MGSLNRLYPLFADLTGRKVLVVGGGAVAERKARSLLETKAVLYVGAPDLSNTLRSWADARRLTYEQGEFEEAWLDGAWLVIAATDDAALNARIKRLADQRRIFVNVVDDRMHSSFHVPAVVDRSPILIAVSSGGAAPVLARRLRERMESIFDDALGRLGVLMQHYRKPIRHVYPDDGARREFYDWLCDGPVLELLRQDNYEQAELTLQEGLVRPLSTKSATLSLITSIGGDPSKLTLGGLRTLHQADAIVFEDNQAQALLSLARRDAEQLRLSQKDTQCSSELAKVLDGLSKRHRHISVLNTNSAKRSLFKQTAAMLSQSGLSCRVVR